VSSSNVVDAICAQSNFPERVHRVIVYPSGFVFYGIWNIVKWFLDPVTQAKVQPMLALSGVQQYIDDEYIPKDLVRVRYGLPSLVKRFDCREALVNLNLTPICSLIRIPLK
jgi:hypothetical protein